MNIELLREVRDQITVAHHIPGRMRLKFSLSLARHPRAKELADTAELPQGITGARVNLMARSMILEYDTAVVAPEVFKDFFKSSDPERFAAACARLEEVFGPVDGYLAAEA